MTVPFLVFDCDGVLADTERNGHLPAFNETFVEFGLPVQWSEADYAEKVLIGGGKERMASLLTPEFVAAAGLPADRDGQRAEVARWHRRKTEIYTRLVESGAMPGRPGIARIVERGRRCRLGTGRGVHLGGTVGARCARARGGTARPPLRSRSSPATWCPRKKPAPDIYLLALAELGARPG